MNRIRERLERRAKALRELWKKRAGYNWGKNDIWIYLFDDVLITRDMYILYKNEFEFCFINDEIKIKKLMTEEEFEDLMVKIDRTIEKHEKILESKEVYLKYLKHEADKLFY